MDRASACQAGLAIQCRACQLSNLLAALLRLRTGLGERDRLADSDLLCADLHAKLSLSKRILPLIANHAPHCGRS